MRRRLVCLGWVAAPCSHDKLQTHRIRSQNVLVTRPRKEVGGTLCFRLLCADFIASAKLDTDLPYCDGAFILYDSINQEDKLGSSRAGISRTTDADVIRVRLKLDHETLFHSREMFADKPQDLDTAIMRYDMTP